MYTKSQLQSLLKKAGQAISGNVPELARRLVTREPKKKGGRSADNSRSAADRPNLPLPTRAISNDIIDVCSSDSDTDEVEPGIMQEALEE